MRRMGRKRQRGFTVLELIIAMCIGAILSSIALAQVRDYVRRSKVSEVMMALSACKNTVSENYMIMDSAPNPGSWGCEGRGTSVYAGAIATSSDGIIRVPISNLDGLMDGRFIYMVPARPNAATAMTTPNDLGKSVGAWICGSDWQPVRNALPANCRSDTTTYASQEYR